MFWKYAANLQENKAIKQLYCNRTSAGCSSVNLLHFFRTPFLKNTSGGLLLAFKQELSNTLTLNFCNLKTTSSALSKKNWSYFLKCAKNNYVCFNEMIWLLLIKMRLQIQNRSHRYGKNKPWPNFLFTISEMKRDY